MVLFIDSCYQFLILDPRPITSLFDSSKCFNHPRSLPLRVLMLSSPIEAIGS
ncbi:hypothetical protein HanXRQr2_Chr14g0667161 [Helianthus annuus]|uniref:Uncharacterized protein n=1 Tax=Helianthus annuus TaxID=4232 RepID=A0A251SN91_HELAN|nr:hypothetical protein HanXRQr2_Chr14g0667161 [Helianthus annuus]KAJ0842310.1 hypothetical protein HanPSC8_Chr14g0640211 [Helianthus annuus]